MSRSQNAVSSHWITNFDHGVENFHKDTIADRHLKYFCSFYSKRGIFSGKKRTRYIESHPSCLFRSLSLYVVAVNCFLRDKEAMDNENLAQSVIIQFRGRSDSDNSSPQRVTTPNVLSSHSRVDAYIVIGHDDTYQRCTDSMHNVWIKYCQSFARPFSIHRRCSSWSVAPETTKIRAEIVFIRRRSVTDSQIRSVREVFGTYLPVFDHAGLGVSVSMIFLGPAVDQVSDNKGRNDVANLPEKSGQRGK